MTAPSLNALSTTLVVLLCLLSAGGSAAGEEEPAKKPALTPAQAADRVLAAVRIQDDAALVVLATRDAPDPWRVADELCSRGEDQAAAAFATAAPRPDTNHLPAFVKTWRPREDEVKARQALAAVAAAADKEPKARLALLDGYDGDALSVTGLRITVVRGTLLVLAGRTADGIGRLRRAGESARKLGWLALASRAYDTAASFLFARGDPAGAAAAEETAIRILEERKQTVAVMEALERLGVVYKRLGRYEDAIAAFKRSIALARTEGHGRGLSKALAALSSLHQGRGDLEKARTVMTDARAIAEKAKSWGVLARMDRNLLGLESDAGRYEQALVIGERARKIAEDHGLSEALVVDIEIAEAWALIQLRRFDEARTRLARSLAYARRNQAAGLQRRALSTYAHLHAVLGELAPMLSYREEALRAAERVGDRFETVNLLVALANDYRNVGRTAEAQQWAERGLAEATALGAARPLANILVLLCAMAWERQDDAAAEKHALRALEIIRKAGLADLLGRCLTSVARALMVQGKTDEARVYLEEAIAREGEGATTRDVFLALVARARLETVSKNPEGALAYLERARPYAEAGGADVDLHMLELNIAVAHNDNEDYWAATEAARRAVELMGRFLGGFSHEGGAAARQRYVSAYEVGLQAAIRAGDSEETFFFVESGRGLALLEALGGRARLRDVSVPKVWRDRENAARKDLGAALARYALADRRRSLRALRKASQDVATARRALGNVLNQMERSQRAAAHLVYPTVPPLETVQEHLAPDQVLVLYGETFGDSFAVVATRRDARMVGLGRTRVIEEAIEAAGFESDQKDPAEAVARLRELLVAPLELYAKSKRVFVSPIGRIGYVPLALLMPGKEVVYVPSATTFHVLGASSEERGQDVLALGDPGLHEGQPSAPTDGAACNPRGSRCGGTCEAPGRRGHEEQATRRTRDEDALARGPLRVPRTGGRGEPDGVEARAHPGQGRRGLPHLPRGVRDEDPGRHGGALGLRDGQGEDLQGRGDRGTDARLHVRRHAACRVLTLEGRRPGHPGPDGQVLRALEPEAGRGPERGRGAEGRAGVRSHRRGGRHRQGGESQGAAHRHEEGASVGPSLLLGGLGPMGPAVRVPHARELASAHSPVPSAAMTAVSDPGGTTVPLNSRCRAEVPAFPYLGCAHVDRPSYLPAGAGSPRARHGHDRGRRRPRWNRRRRLRACPQGHRIGRHVRLGRGPARGSGTGLRGL